MVHVRIVPWSTPKELEELKQWFYSNNADEQKRAVQRVSGYQSKGSQYLPHVIDSTAQLTNALLNDSDANPNNLSIRLTYTMVLIRFVNGILDPNQKSQFAIPLHTIAKNVGLSSWFVDLRHWGTHERELPSLDMLRIATREALQWLWDHYWDDNELDDADDYDDDYEDEFGYDFEGNEGNNEKYGFNIAQLKQLINIWQDEMAQEFKAHKELWINKDESLSASNSSTRLKLISSDNFIVPDKEEIKQMEKRKLVREKLQQYINLWREQWRPCKDKLRFIDIILINSKSKTDYLYLIKLLINKLNEFEIKYFEWILKHYHESVKNSKSNASNKPIDKIIRFCKRKYSTWDEFNDIIIKRPLNMISLKVIIKQYLQWQKLFERYPTYLTVKICYILINHIKKSQESGNDNSNNSNDSNSNSKNANDDWRNKKLQKLKKRKRQLNIIDDDIKFKEILEGIITNMSTNKKDSISMEDEKILYEGKREPEKKTESFQSTNVPETGISVSTKTTDILNDLELLKEQLKQQKEKIKHKDGTAELTLWKVPGDWTPKPFGML